MRLNQIIAIEDGTKKTEYADVTKAHHVLQKPELFSGFVSTYAPLTEDPSLQQPDQRKVVQQNAKQIIAATIVGLSDYWNVVATKDIGNCSAKANIEVDGDVLAENVPVTHLLFLEKQLNDLRLFIAKLPVLDPSKEWEYDSNKGMYKTKFPEKKIRTRKVHKSLIKIEPGPHGPGQADIITVDETEGTWTQVDVSTAYPQDEIRAMLERVMKLQSAVKAAREEANSVIVTKSTMAGNLVNYVFGTK